MPNTPELLPCPFCGGEAHLVECAAEFYVSCKNQKCNPGRNFAPTAVADWNTRVQQTALTDEKRKALEAFETIKMVSRLNEMGQDDYKEDFDKAVIIIERFLQSIPAVKEGCDVWKGISDGKNLVIQQLETSIQYFSELVDAYKDSEKRHLELLKEAHNHLDELAKDMYDGSETFALMVKLDEAIMAAPEVE